MDDERRSRDPGADGIAHAPTIAAPVAVPAEPPAGIPPMIGHFALRSRLGAGGMGEVFAGVDVDLGRAVAIKLVRADVDSDGYRARLLREAQAMARLEHPNVVRVYEIGNDAGRLFVAMELVDGETLSRWLRAPRAWPDIVAMFEQVGAGLAAVHRAGLVHRDFKPDNVLVDRSGRARVADFGLARLAAVGTVSPMAGALTRTGAVMGTPAYMAPEQQFGEVVDARADQYSFCVALREALIHAGAWDAVPALRAAVARGLSYDAAERFATLEQLLDGLRAARDVLVGAVGAVAAPPVARTRTRNRGLVVAVASLAAVAAGATTVAVVRDPLVPPAPLVAAPISVPISAPISVVDAAVVVAPVAVVAPVPADAATPPSLHHARRDAGADHAAAPPAADVGGPAHLQVIRETIRDLDYDSVDLAALDRDPRAVQAALEHDRDAATGDDQQIADVELGMVARRRGDCATAESLWLAATKQLVTSRAPTTAAWRARAWFGLGLCALAADRLDDAKARTERGWVAGNQPEVELALAVIEYEQGNKPLAHARFIAVSHRQDARVQAGLARWLAGTGLQL